MSEILRVPSIWDYLAGGAQQGITTFQEAKQRTRDEELRKLGILSSLFNQGAVDNTDLMPALGKAGISANVQPNAPQKQRQILSSPVNPATGQAWSGDERKLAGLSSSLEQIEEETKYKYITGGAITPRQAAAFKLPTDDEIAEGRMLETNKMLASIAPGYIDATIASMGGVSPKNAAKVIDTAYARYVADRQAKGLSVDPAHRSFFGSQVMDRLVQSEKLSLDWHQANSQRISATRPQVTSQDRQFATLTGAVESSRKALDDHRSKAASGTPLGYMLIAPTRQNDPTVIEYKTEEAALAQEYSNAVKARSLAGSLSPEQSGLLAPVKRGGPQSPAAGKPLWGPDKHAAAAKMIMNRQGTLAQLAEQVVNGKMSQADFMAIREMVAAPQRKK